MGYAVTAYVLWGVLPVYWKLLQRLGAPEILAHRVVWSVVFLVVLVTVRREWPVLQLALRNRRMLGGYGVAAGLLACNWGFYIWGVNTGRLVEASLGYYINPLVSVLLAAAFLRERLRRLQWACVILAGFGVLELTWYHGRPPWLALLLASTFGLYGLTKKLAPLGVVPGLALETATLAPAALVYLAWLNHAGHAAFGHGATHETLLLAFAGVVTSLPLLLFARAAQMVSLTTLGLLQYSSPSIGLLLGVLAYGEPFPPARAVGFAIIWLALGLYWVEGRWTARGVR